MKKYNLQCIKCSNKYETIDPDPYYCAECNKERLKIAKEVDKTMANRPKRNTVSGIQQFDEIAKARGGGSHVNIADLGISL